MTPPFHLQEDQDAENSFGLCILDAATSEFNMSTFVDDVCGTRLETIIRQLRPKEILYIKVCFITGTLHNPLRIDLDSSTRTG